MKKIVLMLSVLMIFIVGCGEKNGANGEKESLKESMTKNLKQTSLKQEIKEMQKELPKDLGEGLVLTKVELVEGNLIYSCKDTKLTKDEYDYSAETKESVKTSMKNFLKASFGQEEFKDLVDTKVNIKYDFFDKNEEPIYDVTITVSDMKEML